MEILFVACLRLLSEFSEFLCPFLLLLLHEEISLCLQSLFAILYALLSWLISLGCSKCLASFLILLPEEFLERSGILLLFLVLAL